MVKKLVGVIVFGLALSLIRAQVNPCTQQTKGVDTLDINTNPFNPTTILDGYISDMDSIDANAKPANACTQYELLVRVSVDTVFLTRDIQIINNTMPLEMIFLNTLNNGAKVVLKSNSTNNNSRIFTIGEERTTISNVTLIQGNADTQSLVRFQNSSQGSIIKNAHMDILKSGTGVDIANDTILVEKVYFRNLETLAPADIPKGIHISANVDAIETRANLFYNTGFEAATHNFVMATSTFLGHVGPASQNPVKITGGSGAFKIVQNLFAIASWAHAHVIVNTNKAANDTIRHNAFTSTSGQLIANIGTYHGVGTNVLLSKGMSDYSATNPNVLSEYPVDLLATDATLSPTTGNPQFQIASKFVNFTSVIPNIASSATALNNLFPSFNYDVLQGDILSRGFSSGISVGAFGVASSTIFRPSPVDSIHFSITADGLSAVQDYKSFDTTFYGTIVPTQNLYYLMSSDSATLAGTANTPDTSIASNASIYLDATNRSETSNNDTIIIPAALRLVSTPIYVRLLHERNSLFSHSLASSKTPRAVGKITGVPQYPISDFTWGNRSTIAGLELGIASLAITEGNEQIDSVMAIAYLVQPGLDIPVDTLTLEVKDGNEEAYGFSSLPKGDVYFTMTPIGIVGITSVVGTNIITSDTVAVKPNAGDTLYVHVGNLICNNQDETGNKNSPFCGLDSTALSFADPGNVFLVTAFKGGPDLTTTSLDLTNTKDSLTFVSQNYISGDKLTRPVLQKVVVSRPGTIIKGFVIEAVDAVPAMTITVDSAVIEGNYFRGMPGGGIPTSFSTPLIQIASVTSVGTIVIQNNFIYGGQPGINIGSNIKTRIINNTFAQHDFTSLGISGTVQTFTGNIIIANNLFTGVGHGYTDAGKTLNYGLFSSLSSFTASMVIERNVFAEGIVGWVAPFRNSLAGVLNDAGTAQVRGNHSGKSGDDLVKDTWEEFESLFDCATSDFTNFGCSPLISGSSPSYPVTKDLLGNNRIGRPEVGAVEKPNLFGSNGQMTISTTPGVQNEAGVTLVAYNIEPALYDSVHIWWQTKSLVVDPAKFPVYETNKLASFDSAALSPFGFVFNGKMTNLGNQGGIKYIVCYGFSGLSTGTVEPINCEEFETPVGIYTLPCSFTLAGGELYCPPPPPGQNPDKSSVYSANGNGINTEIRLALNSPADLTTTSVISGGPVPLATISAYPGVTFDAAMPYIHVPTAATLPNNNFYNLNINIKVGSLDTTNLNVLQVVAEGLEYIPSWSWDETNKILSIQSRKAGQVYFSRTPTNSGTISSIIPSMAAFNADASNSVTLSIAGASFNTSNPLIMIHTIAAGSVENSDIYDAAKYFTKPVLLNSELASLDVALRNDWLVKYFNYFNRVGLAGINYDATTGRIPIPFPSDPNTIRAGFTVSPLSGNITSGNWTGGSVNVVINNFVGNNSALKRTRGMEFLVTVFDGGRTTMNRVLLPATFSGVDFGSASQITNLEFLDVYRMDYKKWYMYAYPWTENNQQVYHLVGDESGYSDKYHRIWTRSGLVFTKYDGTNSNLFSVASGKPYWVAAAKKPEQSGNNFRPISSGGTTLDDKTYPMVLDANVWKEFGIPFNFPLKWADVLSSSLLADNSLPDDISLVVYQYNPSWKNTEGVQQVGQTPWIRITRDSVVYPWIGYVARPTQNVAINFMVKDLNRSTAVKAAKRGVQPGYEVVLAASNGSYESSVTLGKRNRHYQIPELPGFPGQTFQFILTSEKADKSSNLSTDIRDLNSGVEGYWTLKGRSFEGTPQLDLRVKTIEGLSDSVGIYLIETFTNTIVPLNETESASISSEELNKGNYLLAIGDENYVNNLLPSQLLRFNNFPNPFTNATTFKYNLPLSYSQSKVHYVMEVFDLQGKVVHSTKGSLNEGQSNFQYDWNGKDSQGKLLPNGSYLVQISIESTGLGSLTNRRKIVKLR